MPWSLDFKPCKSCQKPMPMSDSHSSCLKCLRDAHVQERCRICRDFKLHTKKDRDVKPRTILLEAALQLSSEPGLLNSAPSTSALLRSTPVTLKDTWHHSPSPALRGVILTVSKDLWHDQTSPMPKKDVPARDSWYRSQLLVSRKKQRKTNRG